MCGVILIRLEDCEQLVVQVPGANDLEGEFVEGRALTTLITELGVSISEPATVEVFKGETVTTHNLEIPSRVLRILVTRYFPADFSGPGIQSVR